MVVAVAAAAGTAQTTSILQKKVRQRMPRRAAAPAPITRAWSCRHMIAATSPDRRLVLGASLTLAAAVAVAGRALLTPASSSASADSSAADHTSRIVLGDSLVRLVRAQVLVPEKLHAIYAQRGGIPRELEAALTSPMLEPIVLTRGNAALYVNLLWPVGLANRMRANDNSPINGRMRFGFASVGGWTLGAAPNGGFDFNHHEIVALTPQQDARAAQVARATYRPCCDNSTFFQDCNHGSALLGLLALGAAQGLNEDDLYREALAFNAHWFPDQYRLTAAFFRGATKREWAQLDPRVVLSAKFSSASGWRANVAGRGEAGGSRAAPSGPGCSA